MLGALLQRFKGTEDTSDLSKRDCDRRARMTIRANTLEVSRRYLPTRIRRALHLAARFRVRRSEMTLGGMLTLLRVAGSPLSVGPEVINVELTNICNQKCAFCPTGVGTNQRPNSPW